MSSKLLKISVFVLILGFYASFLAWVFNAEAISLPADDYPYGTPVIPNIDNEDIRFFLYNIEVQDPGIFLCTGTTASLVGSSLQTVCGITLRSSNNWLADAPLTSSCDGLSYQDCRGGIGLLSERFFTISNIPPLPGPSSLTPPAPPARTVLTQYRPEIKLSEPREGIFSSKIGVRYEATDKNNDTTAFDRELFGFGSGPVALFYTTFIEFWDKSFVKDDIKKLIAKNLPASGFYEWDTKGVPEGEGYRIVGEAHDNTGDIGQDVSEMFFIDHSPPVFRITTEPAVSRGEDVAIKVEPSEELQEAPVIYVTQKGFGRVTVLMSGEKKAFQGIYKVISGYDGPALISVSGKDMAGNNGSNIVSGGQFSVGVEPPPRPLILAPLDKDIVSKNTITVKGHAREDTKVILLLNGTKEFAAKPDKDGNFVFENILLNPDFNNGLNFLSVTSRDGAGNISEAASVSVKFNISPEISIINPQKGVSVASSTAIRIKASDKNKDKLIFTYEVSRDAGKNWTALSTSTLDKQYLWDTTGFPDGAYIVRASASDGFVTVHALSDTFFVRNLVPLITFEGDGPLISGVGDVIIKGLAASNESLTPRPIITGMEYSKDKGKSWTDVEAIDGAFDSVTEQFRLSLNNLPEKRYEFIFRAKDSRGFLGSATKIVVVDFGPPDPPVVIYPKEGDALGNSDDQDNETAGVQFTLKGTAEPESDITINVDNRSVIGKTSPEGKFAVRGVTLRNHGENEIRVFATDAAGNHSKDTILKVVQNNPPLLKFVYPRSGRGLHDKSAVKWEVEDPEGDSVENVVLSYRKGLQSAFVVLVRDATKNSAKNSFEWDVSRLKDGKDYELKLEADDGVSKSSIIIPIYIDRTPPDITVYPFTDTYSKPKFTVRAGGEAFDNLSGVEFVEYTIDGVHWFKAITKGFLERKTVFSLTHPFTLEDGTYEIKFRATDAAGNESHIKSQKIRVDTTPPRVGSYILSSGVFSLLPEENVFLAILGSMLDLVVSLESDTKDAGARVGDEELTLLKNNATGLWETKISLSSLGVFPIFISAKDLLGNKLDSKEVGKLAVIKKGKALSVTREGKENLVSDAKITVLVPQEETQNWIPWSAEAYGGRNPLTSDDKGEYEMLLPSGRYRLRIEKEGFVRLKTSDFEVFNPKFINIDFKLNPREGLRGWFEDVLEKVIR